MNSVGLVEVKNVSKGVKVTDEMLKSAGVTLLPVWRSLSGQVCDPGRRRLVCDPGSGGPGCACSGGIAD